MDNALDMYIYLINNYRFLGHLPKDIKTKMSNQYHLSPEMLDKIYQYAQSI